MHPSPHPEHFLPTLLVVAAPVEVAAVLKGLGRPGADPRPFHWSPGTVAPGGEGGRRGVDLVMTGIGKANAAAATAIALERARAARSYSSVISLGIGGALPGSDISLGDVVAGSASVYADEGLLTPQGFSTCAEMGFPLGPFPGNSITADRELLAYASELADDVGWIATVSTCSGTDRLALDVKERTRAIVECMEGAAVAHVCAAWTPNPVRFVELRVISNTTGDRAAQRWDIKLALSRLAELSRQLVGSLSRGSSGPNV